MTKPAFSTIEKTITENPVVLYMKGTRTAPQCGFSAKVVQILDSVLEDYVTVDVLSDPSLREGIKQYSSWPTIPQLFVSGEFIGGSDIVTELFDSGSLEQKLEGLSQSPARPKLTLSPKAAEALRAALENPDEKVRLQITGAFENDLSIGGRQAGDIELDVSGVNFILDRASARRADGVSIDYIETPSGPAFKIDNPNEPPRVRSMTAEDLKQRLDRGDALRLVDVRTEQERSIAHISGDMPLQVRDLEELDPSTPLVFYCHHGIRSRSAAEQFLARGFKAVYNLEGGIDTWAQRVDPKMARY